MKKLSLTRKTIVARKSKKMINDVGLEAPNAQTKWRAPSKCSLCSSFEHTALTYLERTESN